MSDYGPNGWDESAKLVFSELRRLSDGQDKVRAAQVDLAVVVARVDTKLDNLSDVPKRLGSLEREAAKQKVRTGFIATLMTVVTVVLMKWFGVNVGGP